VIVGGILVDVLGSNLNRFLSDLPKHEAALEERLAELWVFMETHGVEAPDKFIYEHTNPQVVVSYLASTARAFSGVLSNVFFIFLIVAFVLSEIESFMSRFSASDAIKKSTVDQLNSSVIALRRYVALKTILSLLTGVLVFVWLWLLGVDYPVFMGLLAFLLNFVPTLGSVLAAIPAVLMAFTQYGPEQAGIVALGYVVINFVVSNILEPRILGEHLGLSPLAIIVSMVCWGWILGPVGMLLSVPLTITLRIMIGGIEGAKWLEILIGGAPAKPNESK
jgi:predicted PurR-regulated permease PerM